MHQRFRHVEPERFRGDRNWFVAGLQGSIVTFRTERWLRSFFSLGLLTSRPRAERFAVPRRVSAQLYDPDTGNRFQTIRGNGMGQEVLPENTAQLLMPPAEEKQEPVCADQTNGSSDQADRSSVLLLGFRNAVPDSNGHEIHVLKERHLDVPRRAVPEVRRAPEELREDNGKLGFQRVPHHVKQREPVP